MKALLFITTFLLIGSSVTALTIESLHQIRDQFMSPSHKIKIREIPKEWILTNASEEENLLAQFRHKEHKDLVLSLRVDNLERFPSDSPDLKKYIYYYSKKYPRAGLEILNDPKSSIFQHYAQLNLIHKDTAKSTRQTILWHPDKKVFIFSCTGMRGNEKQVKRMCDSIISKIQWM
jgi:hypothetical protein